MPSRILCDPSSRVSRLASTKSEQPHQYCHPSSTLLLTVSTFASLPGKYKHTRIKRAYAGHIKCQRYLVSSSSSPLGAQLYKLSLSFLTAFDQCGTFHVEAGPFLAKVVLWRHPGEGIGGARVLGCCYASMEMVVMDTAVVDGWMLGYSDVQYGSGNVEGFLGLR